MRFHRPRVLWTSYQRQHIEDRHGVTRNQFEQAWRDRIDLGEFHHPNGPYFVSFGFTDDDWSIEMVWRWQGGHVWPITAYAPEDEQP